MLKLEALTPNGQRMSLQATALFAVADEKTQYWFDKEDIALYKESGIKPSPSIECIRYYPGDYDEVDHFDIELSLRGAILKRYEHTVMSNWEMHQLTFHSTGHYHPDYLPF